MPSLPCSPWAKREKENSESKKKERNFRILSRGLAAPPARSMLFQGHGLPRPPAFSLPHLRSRPSLRAAYGESQGAARRSVARRGRAASCMWGAEQRRQESRSNPNPTRRRGRGARRSAGHMRHVGRGHLCATKRGRPRDAASTRHGVAPRPVPYEAFLYRAD